MKNVYIKEVQKHLQQFCRKENDILTENDILHLPGIVQKYLHFTGSVGREKVWNFRAAFKGGIRGKSDEPFMKLRSEQYNFFEKPTRLFYIVAKKGGIPAKGIHIYKNASAIMRIKILGLFTVVDAHGIEMDKGETVTVFNDMCVMAPASLIDKNISWTEVDTHIVRGTFTNNNITISALLYFDSEGRLLNFISNDRYETTDGKTYMNYQWETPILRYRSFNGYNLASEARLIYKHPEEDFCYGEFELESIEYNCREFRL